MDHVHQPPPSPRPLSAINTDIAALMRLRGGTAEERAGRVERYHELLAEYLDARERGGGREGEDDGERAA